MKREVKNDSVKIPRISANNFQQYIYKLVLVKLIVNAT